MADLGLAEYCQHARSVDVELLKAQFTKAEKHRAEIGEDLERLNAERSGSTREQFADLSRMLLGR